jgi:hypothetical protein
MNKNQSTKAPQAALRQLEASQMRMAGGAGRLRVPVGYTDTGEPIYEEIDASQPTGDSARMWKPSGV